MRSSIEPPEIHQYSLASTLEWLQTDGVGGVSSSTVLGTNTRKHHAVLSVGGDMMHRQVLAASLQETIVDGGKAYDLSTNAYSGAIHPKGYLALTSFETAPWPRWCYRFGEITVEKEMTLVHGEHTVVVSYTMKGSAEPVTLVVRPLLAFRDHNSLRSERGPAPANWDVSSEFVECRPFPEYPALFIAHPNAKVETIVLWYRGFLYERDGEAHFDCVEDLFHPGYLEMTLAPGEVCSLVLSTPSPRPLGLVDTYLKEERERGKELLAPYEVHGDPFLEALIRGADAFVFERDDGGTAISPGLPWGESCMYRGLLAFSGLLLTPKRFDAARNYLTRVADHWWQTQAPLEFGEDPVAGQMHAADVPLWAFVAAWRYWKATGDEELMRASMVPLLEDIATYYMNGREIRYRDGLIEVGHEMGATYAAVMPLGTNALWYNAQMILADLMTSLGEGRPEEWQTRAGLTKTAFAESFGCKTREGFANGVQMNPPFLDESVRASQVLAIGLPFSLADDPEAVGRLVAEHLATPYGPRTLSPKDSRYVGDGLDVKVLPKFWSGSIDAGWFGCYCDGMKRAGLLEVTRELFGPFEEELTRRGQGHISGAFGGDAPHEAFDSIASASGLAEVLRIYARDVLRFDHVV